MAFVGCSDDNDGSDPRIPATSVVVDVTEQDLHVGETLQLTATPTPANTTDKVQWTSDDPATATVSETGLVTAVALGSTSVRGRLRRGVGHVRHPGRRAGSVRTL